MVVCNMGALYGTVLSTFLLTLNTADFMHDSANCHLQISLTVSQFLNSQNPGSVLWMPPDQCGENQRDGGGFPQVQTPENIQRLDIDMMKSYNYLGRHLSNVPDWSDNTNAPNKTSQSSLYLQRRHRSFVQETLLRTFLILLWHQQSVEQAAGEAASGL